MSRETQEREFLDQRDVFCGQASQRKFAPGAQVVIIRMGSFRGAFLSLFFTASTADAGLSKKVWEETRGVTLLSHHQRYSFRESSSPF